MRLCLLKPRPLPQPSDPHVLLTGPPPPLTISLILGYPVVACAQSFLHLHDNDADLDMPICVYFERKGDVVKSVTSTHLVALLWLWVGNIGFIGLGFHPHDIGSHYLQSGGTMTLYQAGQYDSTTKVIGRWCSDDFLIYLQGQVATFTKGVSKAMAEVPWFIHQVPNPCQP